MERSMGVGGDDDHAASGSSYDNEGGGGERLEENDASAEVGGGRDGVWSPKGGSSSGEGEGESDQDQEEGGGKLLFSCQCDSARTVATLLSCLRRVVTAGSSRMQSSGAPAGVVGAEAEGGDGVPSQRMWGSTQPMAAALAVSGASSDRIQHATVYAGPDGLTFHVQHGLAKQSQCSVDMPKGLFREYFVGEEEVWLEESGGENDEGNGDKNIPTGGSRQAANAIIQGGEFGVNLTTVLECFSILSKNRDTLAKSSSGGGGGGKAHLGEYALLGSVPLCMSYDRGTATFHLEFLEGGSLANPGGGNGTSSTGMGGCLVTCEVPGVAVADDVGEGPDDGGSVSCAVDAGSGLAAAFRSSPLLSRAILHSNALQSAVSELYDVPGASVVQMSLLDSGMKLGAVGPRSEVWVDLPYHRGQGGMYVGLECYKPNVPLLDVKEGNFVMSYPLGAFLSGMRGLDIGVETCVSINTRGMMAIQHQILRDGLYASAEDFVDGDARPCFVDFIMTCIEDEEESDVGDGNATLQDDASYETVQKQHSRLQEISNNEQTVSKKIGRNHYSTNDSDDIGSNEASGHKKIGQCYVDHGDNSVDQYLQSPSCANDKATRILEELEMDQNRPNATKGCVAVLGEGKINALDDIRQRRQKQRLRRQGLECKKEDNRPRSNDGNSFSNDYENHGYRKKRRYSPSSRAGLRKGACRRGQKAVASNDYDSTDDKEQSECSLKDYYNPYKESQSQSFQSEDDEDDYNGDDSEHEDSLDVTAEIPHLFSKRSSLSTARHGRDHSGSTCTDKFGKAVYGRKKSDEEEAEQEPRMMYGDTKLEFTQDGDESSGSF